MGKNPDEIRREIEGTRDQMGDTVEAIAYRADVKTRTKEKVQGARDSVTGKLANVKESIVGTASSAGDSISGGMSSAGDSITGVATGTRDRIASATPDAQQVKRAASVAQENPMGLAIGSAALGFLVGLAFKSTRVEDERIGPIADQVKEKAKETGQDAVEHGKRVAQEVSNVAAEHAGQAAQQLTETAQEAAERVKETAQGAGQQHAQELKESAQDKAQDVAQTAQQQAQELRS